MPTEAIAALVAFVVFFAMWVILPSVLGKRKANHLEEDEN